jgi:adenylate kinase family enzyme
VPLFAFTDALPRRPCRVLVAGTSGSGKTTVASAIAESLGIPHIEIDALFHGPNWTARPSFEAEVRSFSSRPAWVTEWQYSQVRPLLAERADLVVWLDLPRRIVMRQVIRRTLRRRLGRQTLWNGNIEPPLWTVMRDDEHIVRWAWRTHPKTAARVHALAVLRPELPIVRLRSHDETAQWLFGSLAATTRDSS